MRTLLAALIVVRVGAASAQAPAAAPAAPSSEAPVTLAWLSTRTLPYAPPERQQVRFVIDPLLRFDGRRWADIGRSLMDFNRPDGAVRDEKGRRLIAAPDRPLLEAANLANVPPTEWASWHRLGSGGGPALSAKGSWPSLEQCQPQLLLVPDLGLVPRRMKSTLLASRPLPASYFERQPMADDDPWRKFATLAWRRDEKVAVSKAIEWWHGKPGEPRNPEWGAVASAAMQPKTLAGAVKPPLLWWRSLCANIPNATGAKSADRICQIVARRRYDEKTTTVHDAEPLQYEALVIGNVDGPTKILRTAINPLSLAERGGEPDPPTAPLLLLQFSGDGYLVEDQPLLEGNSTCIQPLRTLANRKAAVCFSTGC